MDEEELSGSDFDEDEDPDKIEVPGMSIFYFLLSFCVFPIFE